MYVVFVNKRKLVLKKTEPEVLQKNEIAYHISDIDVQKVLNKLFDKKFKTVYVYGKSKKKLLKKLSIPVINAAGGLVRNTKGETLFIFRNGKWDLPKGKIEKKETKKDAALREVEEETGVGGLKIKSRMKKTHHLFKNQDVFYIKQTHWYEMFTEVGKTTKPQIEEGITEVAWKKEAEVDALLENAYPSIKWLVSTNKSSGQ